MYHQREKYNQISMITLLLAIIIGLFAIIKSFHFFILLSFYFIAISLLAEALMLHISLRKIEGMKQFVRSSMLFILITFLLIKFMKGS